MGCGKHAEKIQIPLGKLEGLSRERVAGPTATTGLARRAPGPKLPNAITPKHKQSHQRLLSILYYPRRPPKIPSLQSIVHSFIQPPGRACWRASAPLISRLDSQVFATMYVAKIVVTEQELLSNLTVSSLG